MTFLRPTTQLTHAASLALLTAAVAEAEAMAVPQCIVIVDASGEVLASLRMTGAKFLSLRSATAKARTAASTGAASRAVPEAAQARLAAATGGAVTGLPGGLPIRMNGDLVGGIGIGSGTGDQDEQVARAALAAIGADAIGI
jgi:uncharacterized protein GlcG (DUF336 family)